MKSIKVPETFVTHQEGKRVIVADPAYLDLLKSVDIENLPDAGRGRGAVKRLAASDGEHLLVRRYRRGGLLRVVNPDRFVGMERALREIALCYEAAKRGIPVAPAVGAIVETLGPFRLLHIVTKELAEVVDLGDYLAWYPAAPTQEVAVERREITDAVAAAVRKMHDAGLYHADLQVKNILIRQGQQGTDVFFIDLDKSFFCETVAERLRAKNLRRLNRSALKMNLVPDPIDDELRRRFLHAYQSDAPVLKVDTGAFLRDCRRHASFHAIGWRLFKS